MPFSTFSNFRLDPGLPRRLGVLRLIATLASFATLLQWIIPVGLRYALNGGRIYYSNGTFDLWGPVVPWPALSIPAWVTILTGLLAIGSASAYLFLGGLEIANDIAFMTLVPLLAAFSTVFIAALDTDPTGIIRTPGPDGYPIGWQWIVAPFSIVLIIAGITASLRMKRLRAERRRLRSRHVTEG